MEEMRNYLMKLKSDYEALLFKSRQVYRDNMPYKLRTSLQNGRNYYYVTNINDDEISKAGQYLRVQNKALAKEIAENDYALAISKELEHQLREIEKAVKHIDVARITDIYDKLSCGRKELVKPYIISNQEYAAIWQEKEVTHKTFQDGSFEMYSERGERVRSKSEKIIADKLNKMGIPYRYEAPITLPHIGTIYPDFTILEMSSRRELYWEHLGMMDNLEYAEKAIERINSYAKNDILVGDRLILTFETSTHPLDVKNLEKIINMKILPCKL